MLGIVGLRHALRAMAALLVLGPALAMVAASMFDLGPAGEVRFSLFPLALTSFDPFVRTCLGHSLAIAVVVAIGSRLVGLSLGRLMYGSRFPGRRLARVLFIGPIVFPAAFLALGLQGLSEFEPVAEGLFRRLNPLLMRLGVSEWTWSEARSWLGWSWIGIIQGVALILLVMDDCRDRFDPAWEDSARLAGLSGRVYWRKVIRPVIRTRIARVVQLIFGLNLAEAGIPLILDIRRTVGFQVVELSSRPDPFPRLAAIGLLMVGCIAIGTLLIRSWVGPPTAIDNLPPRKGRAQTFPAVRRPWPIGFLAMLVLLGWLILTWLPMFGLARIAFQAWDPLRMFGNQTSFSVHPLDLALTEGRKVRWLINSLAVGACAAAFAMVVNFLNSVGRAEKPRKSFSPIRAISIIPTMLLGISALALPRVLDLMARGLRATFPFEGLADGLDWLSRLLDPTGFPLRLLIFAAVVDIARRSRPGDDGSAEERLAIRERLDAARLLGMSEFRANRLARGKDANLPWAWLVLIMAMPAVSTSPAILLGPTAEGRTITPGIIFLARESAESQARASVLAFCVCMLLIVGWIYAVMLAGRGENGFFKLLPRWCGLDERSPRP